MAPFLEQLTTALQSLQLHSRKLLLAVSGGADSVGLLRGMLPLAPEFELRLVAAHLNHKLRGRQSHRDAKWLKALCRRLDVPVVIGRENVAARAAKRGQGIEEAARQARYEFLEGTALEQGCTHIAVAHTADDQAETILHHIVRGTGISGLRGMSPMRVLTAGESERRTGASAPGPQSLIPDPRYSASSTESSVRSTQRDGPDTEPSRQSPDSPSSPTRLLLVRPLLSIHRSQIEAYLSDLGQDFRTDVTNLDPTFTRNRLRRKLLPFLRTEFNARVDEALLRLGRQAAEAQEAFEALGEDLLNDAVLERRETLCRVDCRVLAGRPRHLVRETLHGLWRQLGWPRRGMGFADWDRLAEVVLTGGATTLPGAVDARRRGHLLVLQRR